MQYAQDASASYVKVLNTIPCVSDCNGEGSLLCSYAKTTDDVSDRSSLRLGLVITPPGHTTRAPIFWHCTLADGLCYGSGNSVTTC